MPAIVRFYDVQSAAFGSITSSYTAVGVPMQRSLRNIIFQNLTDEQVDISFDGKTRNYTMPANSFGVFDICSNQIPSENGLVFSLFTTIYVKYTSGAPSSGEFCYTGFYQGGN